VVAAAGVAHIPAEQEVAQLVEVVLAQEQEEHPEMELRILAAVVVAQHTPETVVQAALALLSLKYLTT
jgi:hypothetical protein